MTLNRSVPIRHSEVLSAEEIARISLGCLQDKKATEIRTLCVTKATILADYFIIATVQNARQAAAASESIRREIKRRGGMPTGTEGEEHGWWTLVDLATVVVHIMQAEARSFYDLDNYWGDSPEVKLDPIMPEEAA